MSGEIAASPPRSAGVARRAAVTAGAVVLFLILGRVPLPFVDVDAFRHYFFWFDPTPKQLAVLALGVTPFVGAFLLVELIAAVMPRLRHLRHGSASDRLKLTRAAWVVAVVLAAWHGWAWALYLQSVRGVQGYPLLDDGLVPILGVTAALVLGTLAAGCLAVLVSRHGLGNGFAVLLAIGGVEAALYLAFSMLATVPGTWREETLLVGLALLVVVPLVIARQGRLGSSAGPRVPIPTCSLVVVKGPSEVLAFPAKLAAWLTFLTPLAKALRLGPALHGYVSVSLTAVLALLLARVFCAPDAVVRAFRRAAPDGFGEEAAAAVRRALATANRRSLALVMGVAMLPTVATWLEVPVRIGMDALVGIGVVIAVAMDLRAESRARAGGAALVTARPVHRVYAVQPVLDALSAVGITAFARTRYFRALFQFFAPYAPIEILVPPERVQEAEEVCARVLVDGQQA